MTHTTNIENFTPQKSLLLGVDSDGCVIDSMTAKHKLCFGPLLVKEWHLDGHKEEILALWESFNLYSLTRGTNRFRSLALVLKEVNANYRPIVGIGNLLHWSQSDTLSEESLIRKIEANREVDIFKKALAWSRAVNRATAELSHGLMQPFSGAVEALEYAGQYADIAVVSGAAPDALEEEWKNHSIYKYAKVMLSQKDGSKTACLEKLLKKGYERAIICGDAVGDMTAAQNCGIFFYPILAGREKESWESFNACFDLFVSGQYEEAEKELKKKFIANLGGESKCQT